LGSLGAFYSLGALYSLGSLYFLAYFYSTSGVSVTGSLIFGFFSLINLF
jgi:hypothetical protein